MKRIAMLLILILLAAPAALAAGFPSPGDYIAAFDPSAEWAEEVPGQLYSHEIAADTTVSLCARDGVLVAVSFTAPRDAENLAELAWSAFAPSGGVPRDELARAIEADESQLQALGGAFLYAVAGEKRFALCLADADADDLFWLPMHGGVCRHLNPSCSGLDVPRLATAAVADALGLPACSKCAGGTAAEIENAA